MSKGMCQKVAVAQALLPGRGLLVLDEAWTGLDVEAKAALDDAVAERVADGGSVVYVDHEPGRLAHLDADRWRLDASRATRINAPDGPVPALGQEAGSKGGVVVIEAAGSLPGRAAELPGVISVQREGNRQIVRAAAAETDVVLRGLLAGDEGVQIMRVDREPEGTEGAG